MLLSLFIAGFVIGFVIAMPVGPIALLCIRNSILLGFKGGFVSGLGAAISDAVIGALAGLGINQISHFLNLHSLIIHTIGAIALIWMGAKIFITAKEVVSLKDEEEARKIQSLTYTFFLMLIFTAINPVTILSYAAMFTALGTDAPQIPNTASLLMLGGGIFWGSLVWWTILAALTVFIKHTLEEKYLIRVNQISGILLVLVGVVTWIKTLL